jgi:hypothetical protein
LLSDRPERQDRETADAADLFAEAPAAVRDSVGCG